MKVVRDNLWFCPCCTLAAVNGDTCDCGPCPVEGTAMTHAEDVTDNLNRLAEEGHVCPDWQSDDDTGEITEGHEDFSWRGCDCCYTNGNKGGEFHRFCIIAPSRLAPEPTDPE